jgi:hypothetical protein
MTKREELLEAVGGEEQYNQLEASRQALVQEALQAGAEEAKRYLGYDVAFKDLLLIAEMGSEDDDGDDDGVYHQLWEITRDVTDWRILEAFPVGMRQYVKQGFVEHIQHVVSLMESTEGVQ